MQTDHELMTAVAQGDLDSMSPLYERRHRALYRFFYRLTSRQTLSEDLTHEVFLRMMRYRGTYNTVGAEFDSWMYRIARNTLTDHARKNRRETGIEPDEQTADTKDLNPFESMAKRQETAMLYSALRQLPEDKRELLVLTRFQGLSHEQIGKVLGCEAGTVKGRVFRAMKEIGRIYEDLLREKAS